MAKMFYTLEEVAAKLGKSEDEVKDEKSTPKNTVYRVSPNGNRTFKDFKTKTYITPANPKDYPDKNKMPKGVKQAIKDKILRSDIVEV